MLSQSSPPPPIRSLLDTTSTTMNNSINSNLLYQNSSPTKRTKEALAITSENIMNSLNSAAKFIQVSKDKLPDLADLLRRSVPTNDPTRSGYGTENDFKYPILEKERNIPLPDALFEQYDLVQCKCFMGLFPEISRAWITIDHRLFLWDYEQQDFCLYEDQDQIIVAVGLVKPIPGVFIDEIKYVLVIATPLEVILLGIGYNANKEITLYNTNMSVSADGVNMTNIVGTDDGRIFMAGTNGNLYELVYQADEGWFTRKCRKINRSSSSVSIFVPTFLKFSTDVPITCMSVDNERKILYILDERSEIEIVYLGLDGKGFEKIMKASNIIPNAQRALETYPYSGLVDTRTFRIVSIQTVPSKGSLLIDLVGITSTGARIYFTTNPRRAMASNTQQIAALMKIPPSTLELVTVRPPPSTYTANTTNNQALMHVGYYKQGLTVIANAVNDDVDNIVGVTLDLGTILQAPNILVEQTSSLFIEGKTWAMAEYLDESLEKSIDNGEYLNELASQFCFSARKLILLTNSGVTILKKKRPIDVLQSLLSESSGQFSNNLKGFFQSFGFDQSCAMCLALACGHPMTQLFRPENMAMSPRLKNPSVSFGAKKFFFEIGGKPALLSRDQGNVFDQIGVSSLAPSSQIEYSGRHGGLRLYITRLIKEVWKTKLFTTDKQGKIIIPNMDVGTLLRVQRNLEALNMFFKENPQFTAPPNPSDMERQRYGQVNNRIDMGAVQAEQQSLHEFDLLVKNTIEAISFVLLLFDHQVSSLVKSLSNAEKTFVMDLSFEMLVTSSRGRETGKTLMMQLVNKQIENQVEVSVISDLLRQRCPSFCSPDDVVLYRGMETLRKAKSSQSMDERLVILKESTKLFSSILSTLSSEKLEEIVEQLKYLRYHVGAVELALLYVKKNDPLDLGLAYFNEGLPLNDPRSDMLNLRRKCYRLVFSIIESLDSLQSPSADTSLRAARKECLNTSLTSEDALFHHDLYTWLIETGRQDEMLSFNTPFIEAFLLKERIHRDVADLLWRFYVEKSDFMKSAKVLYDLAHVEIGSMDLKQRIEYLARALGNAKANTRALSSEETELMNNIQEGVEVAQVQLETYNAIAANAEYNYLLGDLDAQLLDVTTLFKNYARPLGLNEIILLILFTANHQDKYMVEVTWNNIIQQAEQESDGVKISEKLGQKLKELGRRYYPNDNVFPLEYLVNTMSALAFEKVDLTVGWITAALHEIGVEYRVLFEIYNDMFETKREPWQSSKALCHLLHDISSLLEEWLNSVQQMDLMQGREQALPAKYLDEKISQYLLTNVPNDTTGIISRLQTIQGRLRKTL